MVRAIGKGSISSILAATLNVVRIFLWLALIVLGAWFAITLLLGVSSSVADLFPRAPFLSDDDWPVKLLEIAADLARVGIMLYVVDRLSEILRTLRLETPFEVENAARFTRVAGALAAGELIQIGLAVVSTVVAATFDFHGGPELAIHLEVWFVVLVVLVLAAVFREGARMKAEQDLTI